MRRKKGQGFEIGRIAGWAAKRNYGSLIVVNEDRKKPSKFNHYLLFSISDYHFPEDAITIVHLPAGPSAYFKLSSIQLTKEIHVCSLL